MFTPVSKLGYQLLEPTAQAIAVHASTLSPDAVRARWFRRAAASIEDGQAVVRDVVRDLLANPQIRIIVFDGAVANRGAWDDFWLGNDFPDWRIDHEHLALVRQFVDLYDDDFGVNGPMQPFWPARVRYLE